MNKKEILKNELHHSLFVKFIEEVIYFSKYFEMLRKLHSDFMKIYCIILSNFFNVDYWSNLKSIHEVHFVGGGKNLVRGIH